MPPSASCRRLQLRVGWRTWQGMLDGGVDIGWHLRKPACGRQRNAPDTQGPGGPLCFACLRSGMHGSR